LKIEISGDLQHVAKIRRVQLEGKSCPSNSRASPPATGTCRSLAAVIRLLGIGTPFEQVARRNLDMPIQG
jgi:hypothetical protein